MGGEPSGASTLAAPGDVLAAAKSVVSVDAGGVLTRAAADLLPEPVAGLDPVIAAACVVCVAARPAVEPVGTAAAGEPVGATLAEEAITT